MKNKKTDVIKAFQNILETTSWEKIELLAAIQLIVFSALPLIRFFSFNRCSYYTLADNMFMIFRILSLVMLFLYIGKLILHRFSFRSLCVQNRITLVCFGMFMMLMVLSTCVNGFTSYAMHGDPYRNESLFTYLTYFLVFFASGACIHSVKIKRIIFCTFIVCSVLLTVFSFFWKLADRNGFCSVFAQFNHYGYYLTISILTAAGMVVWGKSILWRILSACAYIFLSLALIRNDTFGCYLAVIAGLLFILATEIIMHRKFPKISVLLIAGYCAVSVVYGFYSNTVSVNFETIRTDIYNIAQNNEYSNSAGTGRMKLWRLTVDKIAEKPLIGHGVEGIGDYLSDNFGNDRTHNEYLQYAAFFGIPAALIYITSVFCVFLAGLKRKAKLNSETLIALSAAFGYCFSACFGNTMYYTAPYLFMFLGLGFSLNREKADR